MQGRATFSISPRALELSGLSLDRLCARAGVTRASRWDTTDFFRLWEAADEDIGDRSAGLRFGAEATARGHGPASQVALHATDFRQALGSLSRYKRLTCPELVEVEVSGNEAIVRYRWLQATGPAPRLLVDMTLASLLALAQRGSSGLIAPVRLELSRRPMDRDRLSRHFQCPIVFGAPHDAMVFRREALETPFVTSDPSAFGRLLEGLEQRLAEGEGLPVLVGEVRVAIARQLSEGRSSTMTSLARRLGVSPRTLQRRLKELRTGFQEQLAGVRRTTASRLLTGTDLDTAAIALLLGFAEPNSFCRAFRGWERTTPLRWRERHACPLNPIPEGPSP